MNETGGSDEGEAPPKLPDGATMEAPASRGNKNLSSKNKRKTVLFAWEHDSWVSLFPLYFVVFFVGAALSIILPSVAPYLRKVKEKQL